MELENRDSRNAAAFEGQTGVTNEGSELQFEGTLK